MTTDRVGLLIIRVWIEPGSDRPLRAQLRATTDVASGSQTTVTLTHPDAVGTAVEEWLAEMTTEDRDDAELR